MFEAFSIIGRIGLEGIAAVNQQLTGLQKKMTSAGQAMTSAGKKMTMGLTLPILGAGVAAFKMSGDFDQAMRAANVMLKASGDEMKKYKKEILDLSMKTGKSSAEIAKAFYVIVSAGHRGADAMDILTTSIEGSVGGMADATVTTEAMAKAMEVFGLVGVEGASRAMDVFFGIVDSGLLTFEELATAFPMATASAAGLGISIEEAGAALATLTKVSGSTQISATSLNAVFSQLIKPTEDLQALYEEWGVKSGPEAIEKFGGLQGVLLKVTEATGGTVDQMATLFPNIRAIRAVLPLATTSADTFTKALEGMDNVTGRAGEAFEEMATGPGYQLNVFFATMKSLMITIGDVVSKKVGPIFAKFIDKVKGLVTWIENLSDENVESLLTWGLVLAAIGPVLLIFGQLFTIIPKLTVAWHGLNAAMIGSPLLKIAIYLPALLQFGVAMGLLQLQSDANTRAFGDFDKVLEKVQGSGISAWFDKNRGSAGHYTLVVGSLYKELRELEEQLPGTVKGLQELSDQYLSGAIADEELIEGLVEIKNKSIEYIEVAYPMITAMQGMEAASRNMARETDNTTGATEEQTGAFEDNAEAADTLTDVIDELRSSFSGLLGVLFDGINANNNFQESSWALSEAEEAVNKLVNEGKIGTKEYEEAVNNLDSQLQEHIDTAYQVYTSTYTTREEQEAAKEEALKYGKQMVETGQWGEGSYISLENQFSESAQGIKTDIEGVVLPAFLGMYNAGKEISEMKIEPKIGLDTSEFYAKLRETGRAFAEAYAKYGSKASGGIVNYISGGIASAAQGLITPPRADEGMLAVLHPPELVLNPGQALRVLWNMANEPRRAKTKPGEAGINITNTFQIAELVVREEADYKIIAEELEEMQQKGLRGVGGR